MGTGYEGPMTATRGGHGATVEKSVSGASQRGVFCVCERNAIATLCRESVVGGGVFGGRWVRMWW